ncbi:hypothetical protein ACFSTC_28625 [Nonomuraea ferruginea]
MVWFAAFHVLTIAAERLELAHVVFLRPGAWGGLVAAAALVGAGALVSLAGPVMGARTAGAGMVLVAVWLAWRDVARHTVRGSGLPRYAAACLLAELRLARRGRSPVGRHRPVVRPLPVRRGPARAVPRLRDVDGLRPRPGDPAGGAAGAAPVPARSVRAADAAARGRGRPGRR